MFSRAAYNYNTTPLFDQLRFKGLAQRPNNGNLAVVGLEPMTFYGLYSPKHIRCPITFYQIRLSVRTGNNSLMIDSLTQQKFLIFSFEEQMKENIKDKETV